jgi:hypothetical protein
MPPANLVRKLSWRPLGSAYDLGRLKVRPAVTAMTPPNLNSKRARGDRDEARPTELRQDFLAECNNHHRGAMADDKARCQNQTPAIGATPICQQQKVSS